MDEHLRLGQLFGIRIGINWSVLVIFALILLGLAAGLLPEAVPDREPVAYAAAGLVAAVLFFLSLLAHELSHAVVARRNGVEVEGITLWMFGGVAKLRSEAPTPGAELRIAGVGPFVSLLLSGVFWLLAWIASGYVGPGLTLQVLAWLGLINLVLAIFNLAPASPLDGGRILRAALWLRRGDRTSAAMSASRAGRVFGFLLVGLGLLQLLLVPGIGGLWLVLIGFFIVNAATAEGTYAQVQAGLAGLRVADVMTPAPLTIPQHISVDEAIDRYVLPNRFSSFPVVDADGRPLGLATLQHVKQVPRERWATTSIQRVASPMDDVVTTVPSEPLLDLMSRMRDAPGGRVLVLLDGRLIGIVSPSDIARVLDRAPLRADRAGPGVPTA